MRSLLYLATLSDLEGAPVFICPTPIPTDKSDINASSVSPDLWEIMFLKLFSSDSLIAWKVSDNDPIWLTLISTELAELSFIPLLILAVLVTNKSSPTNWVCEPSSSVRIFQPCQSSSSKPSSIE